MNTGEQLAGRACVDPQFAYAHLHHCARHTPGRVDTQAAAPTSAAVPASESPGPDTGVTRPRYEFESREYFGEACGAVVRQMGDLLVDLVAGADDAHRSDAAVLLPGHRERLVPRAGLHCGRRDS